MAYARFLYEARDAVVDMERLRTVRKLLQDTIVYDRPNSFQNLKIEVDDKKRITAIIPQTTEGEFSNEIVLARLIYNCLQSGSVTLKFVSKDNMVYGFYITADEVIEFEYKPITEEEKRIVKELTNCTATENTYGLFR